MAHPIHIRFDQRQENGELVRRLIFEGVEGRDGPRAESWWRIPGGSARADLPVLDSLVCAHVQWVATLGQDVVVHGPLSAGGLYNMQQMLEIRCAQTPQRYRRIPVIEAEAIVSGAHPAHPPTGVLVALSGGLDSTFTAIRHVHRLVGETYYPVAGLVLVQGFDIPLHQTERFEALRRRLTPLVESLKLPLLTASTNSMALGGRVWPHSSMPLFGGTLVHFSEVSTHALVSSGTPYGTPRFASIAHGSYLDELCSNDFFRISTDGGGFTRAEKAEALLPYPEALQALKVCWQGADPASNCGACPKCIMTRLDFFAVGLRHPPCFDQPLALHHIANLHLPSMSAGRDFYRFCWSELEKRGSTGPEVTLLRQRLSRAPPDFLAPFVHRWARRARRVIPMGARRLVHRLLGRITA